MIQEKNKIAHIVVDMLYDFIDGTLACYNAQDAVKESVKFINDNPIHMVIYVCDSHPNNHCSFAESGGIWPLHCVAGTKGSQVHESFYNQITLPDARPSSNNILRKGEDPNFEQYSGFQAITEKGETLLKHLQDNNVENVFVSGIATEFCVNETVKDLKNAGFKVTVIGKALAYVDYNGHKKTLEEFKKMGVKII